MQAVKALECTSFAIKNDIPLQLWDSITSATGLISPAWVIRALHNKPRYFFVNYTQCYFHYLSPKFLIGQLGPIRFLLLAVLLYVLIKRFPKITPVLILTLALFPLIMIFELYR